MAVLLQVSAVIFKFASVLVLRRFTQIIIRLPAEEALFNEGLVNAMGLFILAASYGTVEPLATQQCQLAVYRLYISVAQAVMLKGRRIEVYCPQFRIRIQNVTAPGDLRDGPRTGGGKKHFDEKRRRSRRRPPHHTWTKDFSNYGSRNTWHEILCPSFCCLRPFGNVLQLTSPS